MAARAESRSRYLTYTLRPSERKMGFSETTPDADRLRLVVAASEGHTTGDKETETALLIAQWRYHGNHADAECSHGSGDQFTQIVGQQAN